MPEEPELTEAARRGIQRAGVHFVRAALEVVAGVSAFLEEVGSHRPGADRPSEEPPQRIDLE